MSNSKYRAACKNLLFVRRNFSVSARFMQKPIRRYSPSRAGLVCTQNESKKKELPSGLTK